MDGQEADADLPPASQLFVVTVNGPQARSEVVIGLDGVREALLRAVLRGPRDAVPEGLDAHLAALGDPAGWAAHGYGDGQPFWHFWIGLGASSVSVQRLTGPLPPDPRALADARNRTMRIGQTAAALVACAAELRTMAAPGDRPRRLRFE